MEAKELRIGNYVLDRGGKILRIDWWENINKVCMDMNINGQKVHPLTEHAEYCQPIPLTEQWLLDFGFETTSIRTYELPNTRGLVIVSKMKGEFLIKLNKNSIWIKHVHQLQNLYFALTGEELTLKKNMDI